ncbi:MAG: YjbQ family protein [Deltaproteobacteria bacterium]|nr:YjbQ family protein [Deltaproteobacteria bacterium]
MIFLKSYFVATTTGVDKINIIHDVKRAMRESTILKGLVTITPPAGKALLTVTTEEELKAAGLVQARSLTLPVEKGDLLLAPREQIFLIDSDPSGRRREFWVQVIGDGAGAAKKAAPIRGPQGSPKR